jgi:hypothetical protein
LLYDNFYYSNEVLRKELQYFNAFVKITGQLGVFPLMAWLCTRLCLWKIMFHYLVSLLNNLFYANTMLPDLTLAGLIYALQGFQGG